jgi:uncharacterized protein YeeX (DUF496 family)
MKIISENHSSKTSIEFENGAEYLRSETTGLSVTWESTQLDQVFKLQENLWWEWVETEQRFQLMTKNIPTLEDDYQQYLLAQYPFEKRVREIIATVSEDAENRVNHIMCQIADDVAFEDLVEEYIK